MLMRNFHNILRDLGIFVYPRALMPVRISRDFQITWKDILSLAAIRETPFDKLSVPDFI